MSPHHDSRAAHTLQSVVHAALGLLHQDLLDGPVFEVFGVDAVGGSEQSSLLKLLGVDVDPDDGLRLSGFAAHDGGQPDGSEPEHGTRGIFFYLEAQNVAVRETPGDITAPGSCRTSCLCSFKHELYFFFSFYLMLAHFILMQEGF